MERLKIEIHQKKVITKLQYCHMTWFQAMLKDQTDRLTSTEDTNMSYLDQIEELTHKLSQAESKVKSFESSRLEEGAKVVNYVLYC